MDMWEGMDEVMGTMVKPVVESRNSGRGAGRVAWCGAALLSSPTFCTSQPCHVDPNSSY